MRCVKKVYALILASKNQANCPYEQGKRLPWFSNVDKKNDALVEGTSIIRVDGQGLVGFLSPSLVVLPEHGNHCGGIMAERILIVLCDRFFGEALGVFECLFRGIAPTVLVIKHIGKRETRVRGSVVRIELEGSAETGRRFLEHL